MAWDLWNKYEEELKNDFQKLFEPINTIQIKIDTITINIPDNTSFFDEIAYTLYWRQIERYFILCNGGIGYDKFIAKRFLSQMILYWLILKNKAIDDNEVEICKVEIETAFYIVINCIYNMKEKWHKFLNTTEKKNDIIFTTLNPSGKKLVLDKLYLLYNDIKSFCSARTYLVHDVFSIGFDSKNDLLNIGRSAFTLSEVNLWKNKSKANHKFTVTDAISAIINLENHRYDLLNTLSNTNYLDINKLKEKYYDEKNKQFTYTFI